MDKMYSAFISSVYLELLDERETIINALLDYNVFPICMEHFVVDSSKNFDEIRKFINYSDFMILLLGKEYGSIDRQSKKSYTEMEYNYARKNNMPLLVLELPDLTELKNLPEECLSDSQKKQLAFRNSVDMVVPVKHDDIRRTVNLFLKDKFLEDNNSYNGWIRGKSTSYLKQQEQELFEANPLLKLDETYYHVHLCDNDNTYIRTGIVTVSQKNFNGDNWIFTFKGTNFSIIYNPDEKSYRQNITKRTVWEEKIVLHTDGTFDSSIYTAKKYDSSSYAGQNIKPGIRRGVHDFELNCQIDDGTAYAIVGSFHDLVQDDMDRGSKAGKIYLFKTPEARDAFLLEYYGETLRLNSAN